MNISDFNFPLPEDLIAQHPLPERDGSRMMVVRRSTGTWEHRRFKDLPEVLDREHFLVVNTTRVFPARLTACRPGKDERIEVLLLRERTPREWLALLKPARKAKPGESLRIGNLRARVVDAREDGSRVLRFEGDADVFPTIEEIGETPLPPYIHRRGDEDQAEDRERYQTVFARQTGSVAAPTAALHFTPAVLGRLAKKGIPVCELLLHIGYGTFQPVRCREVEDHRMESEYFEIPAGEAGRISELRSEGKRLVAVGTTTTRVLEFLSLHGEWSDQDRSGWCDLFIYPGFEFRMLNGLLTNFHLPRSTLFMLVCAFAGRELMLDSYREAVERRYRFFSYGDCMLIL